MKTLFILCMLAKLIDFGYKHQKDKESFYFFKCMIYLICSSIHSVILNIPVPIGACIILIIYIFDHKNRKIKLAMIGMGLFIIVLSNVTYKDIAYPLQKLYLYHLTKNTNSLDIYTQSSTGTDLLFSISDASQVQQWVDILNDSTPTFTWNMKELPESNSYLVKLHTNKKSIDIFLSPYAEKVCNMYLGHTSLAYSNTKIFSLIYENFSLHPNMLTLNISNEFPIDISNSTILDLLWRTIIWEPKNKATSYNENLFTIPSYLFFDNATGCSIIFSTAFEYAYIPSHGIIQLSPYLINALQEQFILSQLASVNELQKFEPSHFHTKIDSGFKFSIETDANQFYNALYKKDYKTNEKTLLHTVNSLNAKYFILKSPYILLLDEKSHNQYFLMLINQNIPEKHRYIAKDQYIVPHSISICPQNLQFAYIIKSNHKSTLYFVPSYYHSPKTIATGLVNDSLFLSSEYIVFTQEIKNQSYLCIYSTSSYRTIRYIPIPGIISLIEAKNNTVYFAVQNTEKNNLKEGLFFIDTDFIIHKYSSHKVLE